LRERKHDIPLLCQHFLTKYKTQIRKLHTGIHPQALQALMDYSWPGNIRELENAIFQAMILATGEILQLEDFHFIPQHPSTPPPTPPPTKQTDTKVLSLDEAIKSAIQNALTASNGKAPLAGELLGLSRSAFYRLLKKYDIR
jgi:DNA-binding NtrC family response regulator